MELSKEEIVEKHEDKYGQLNLWGAMDEYADQESKKKAIAFAEWLTTKSPQLEKLYESEEFKQYWQEQQNKENGY